MSCTAPETTDTAACEASSNWGREKGRFIQKINQLTRQLESKDLQISNLKSKQSDYKRTISQLRVQCKDLRNELVENNRKIELLTQQCRDLTEFSTHPNDKTTLNPALSTHLINELRCLLQVDPRHRRPSQEMLDFAFLIKSLSNRTYRQLRTMTRIHCSCSELRTR